MCTKYEVLENEACTFFCIGHVGKTQLSFILLYAVKIIMSNDPEILQESTISLQSVQCKSRNNILFLMRRNTVL